MEAVAFASRINLPLVAHLTIHWSLADVGDDPNGKKSVINGCAFGRMPMVNIYLFIECLARLMQLQQLSTR